MTDHAITLALGGGAAKGLAHIGVLKGVEEDGLEVAAIVGTSMGSIIGAMAAQGLSAVEMEGLFRAIDWVRLGRIMVTSVSGAAFNDMLRESFGGILIEDLLQGGDTKDTNHHSGSFLVEIPHLLYPVTLDIIWIDFTACDFYLFFVSNRVIYN